MEQNIFKKSGSLVTWGIVLSIVAFLCLIVGLFLVIFGYVDANAGYRPEPLGVPFYLGIALVANSLVTFYVRAITEAFAVVVKASEVKLKEAGECLPGYENA